FGFTRVYPASSPLQGLHSWRHGVIHRYVEDGARTIEGWSAEVFTVSWGSGGTRRDRQRRSRPTDSSRRWSTCSFLLGQSPRSESRRSCACSSCAMSNGG